LIVAEAAFGLSLHSLHPSTNKHPETEMGKCGSKAGCAAEPAPVLLGRRPAAAQAEQKPVVSKSARAGSANSGLVELLYPMRDDFQPRNTEEPQLVLPVTVRVLSSSETNNFGEKGTVVFLHGAGGSADEYDTLWKRGEIDVPSGFTIVFVQTPRTSKWMTPSKNWADSPDTLLGQVDDDVEILKHVLYELQKEAGGYSKLWLCGRSQGACLSALLTVAGVGTTVAGTFSIAATALPQLQDIPSGSDLYSTPSQAKVNAMRMGFYSGELDTTFTDQRPESANGTFPLLKQTLTNLGFFSGDQGAHFWIKDGAGHNNIGPSEQYGGEAFKVLFAFVQEQDPTQAGVAGVRAWSG